MVIPVQTNEEYPTVYDRLQQLRETGELKQVLNEGVAELAGYEADAKYITLYPTNGDAAVRVPINDRDYYLAKPAPIGNPVAVGMGTVAPSHTGKVAPRRTRHRGSRGRRRQG